MRPMFVPGVLAASFSLMALPGAAQTAAPASQPVLVIHGGAGVIRRENSQHDDAAIRRVLETALRNGYAELQAGKPALDDVTAAITVLEDSPYFNAGKGAVFTHEGRNELDASVMVGNGPVSYTHLDVYKRQNLNHPFYWAPFLLVGNWR